MRAIALLKRIGWFLWWCWCGFMVLVILPLATVYQFAGHGLFVGDPWQTLYGIALLLFTLLNLKWYIEWWKERRAKAQGQD